MWHPCGCLAAKFDSCNSLLSSVHTLLQWRIHRGGDRPPLRSWNNFLQKLNNYPLYLDKNQLYHCSSYQNSGSGSTATVLSFSPFHKSTTLALKNFFPPYGFLNSLYMYVFTSRALPHANSTNLFRCSVSCPVVSCTKASIKFPLLLEAASFF